MLPTHLKCASLFANWGDAINSSRQVLSMESSRCALYAGVIDWIPLQMLSAVLWHSHLDQDAHERVRQFNYLSLSEGLCTLIVSVVCLNFRLLRWLGRLLLFCSERDTLISSILNLFNFSNLPLSLRRSPEWNISSTSNFSSWLIWTA